MQIPFALKFSRSSHGINNEDCRFLIISLNADLLKIAVYRILESSLIKQIIHKKIHTVLKGIKDF